MTNVFAFCLGAIVGYVLVTFWLDARARRRAAEEWQAIEQHFGANVEERIYRGNAWQDRT